jgi:hypothetical protein
MRDLRTVLRASALSLVLGASVLLHAGSAGAVSDEDKAGARAAATQGEAAFQAGHWAEALDLFTRAESLVHSPVHLLFKARALVQLGQLVKARETYLSIAHEEPVTASSALTKAREAAGKEEALLEPRLASLTLKVDGPGAADATVTMDGAKVPSVLVGVSRPADPGRHTVQAMGGGVESEPQTFSLSEGGTIALTLRLKPIPGAIAGAVPGPKHPVAAPPFGSGAVEHQAVEQDGSAMRTASYVSFAVGAVGLAAGAVFGLRARSKYQQGNEVCGNQDPCTLSKADAARREQLGKDGDSAKTLSIIGFVAGGVGAAAGITLFSLSAKKKGEPERAGLESWIGLGSLGLRGRF